MHWFLDGNNIMGSVPDGWWNDPPAAAARLTGRVGRWCQGHEDEVVLVFDGKPRTAVERSAGGNLRVEFAATRARDAADDRIVALVEEDLVESDALRVVTADRGLVRRLPPGVEIMGPRAFRSLLDGTEKLGNEAHSES